jgi:catalase
MPDPLSLAAPKVSSFLKTHLFSIGYLLFIALAISPMAVMLWAQQPQDSGREMVDSLHSAFGDNHSRAVHAKGFIVTGYFVPSRKGRTLTIAPQLQYPGKRIRVIARFSDFTGIPTISDADPNANPRGFAIRFLLPDGSSSDLVNHSFNGFPVATAAEFAQLMRAIGSSGPDVAKPSPLDIFLATHPIAKTFLTTQKPAPVSWATTPYFGVNSFKFTNAHGNSCFVRYQFIPLSGEAYLTPSQIHAASKDYLSAEMTHRLLKEPVRFRMQVQISRPGDVIDDPSVAWPSSRKVIDLGVIVLEQADFDPDIDKKLQFQPGRVPAGIAIADPMLAVRGEAYPISARERQ